MKAEDFKTSKKVGDSLFKGAAFHKNDGAEMPKPAAPAKPAVPAQPASPSTGPDMGGGVDFASLPDDMKMAAHLAATQYNGTVDPSKWAQYWSQKEGMAPEGLEQFASYIHNIVQMNNIMNAEQIQEDEVRYPWWSAARNWDPNAIGAWGKKVNDAFTPSSAMIGALTPRF